MKNLAAPALDGAQRAASGWYGPHGGAPWAFRQIVRGGAQDADGFGYLIDANLHAAQYIAVTVHGPAERAVGRVGMVAADVEIDFRGAPAHADGAQRIRATPGMRATPLQPSLCRPEACPYILLEFFDETDLRQLEAERGKPFRG